jgi:hypothetical protein
VRYKIVRSQVFDNQNIDKTLKEGLSYKDASKLGFEWKSNGLNNVEINILADKTGKLLSSDGYGIYQKKILMGLASSGFIMPYCFSSMSEEVFPGMSADAMCKHLLSHYRYLSWIDAPGHSNMLRSFFLANNAFDEFYVWKKAKQASYSMLAPYTYDLSIVARNPLKTGVPPPDIWGLCGVLALLVLLAKEELIATGIAIIIIINFIVCFIFPVGDIRYGYAIFPLYFISISILLGSCQFRKIV